MPGTPSRTRLTHNADEDAHGSYAQLAIDPK